ncbi:MAG: class A beta-lactamase-related serine hydrolase, partial [Gammaproteobacteria bacterium]|nr:class A beta-lactamase-related serine hydrolase [Gammaproteobacteria bacterium]
MLYKILKNRSLFAIRLIATLLLGIASTSSAFAEEPLEKSTTTPTAWTRHYGVTAATITAQVNAGYRIIDIEVVNATTPTFNVVTVANSGENTSAWWWYYGITSSQLSSYLASNNARLIDIESYFVNGTRYFAVVMIQNSGTRASSWWYYYGQTFADLSAKLKANNARLIDVDTYEVNGVRYYDSIMIQNTGTNSAAWWWYTDIPVSDIGKYANTNDARLIDIERQSNGKYTVVMIKNSGSQWWWLYGVTADNVNSFLSQYGTRIIDIESYLINGEYRYDVIYLNNVNAQTSRVRDLIANKRTGGTFGLYVKEVNASTKVALMSSTPFEPASTIKAVHHIHGMKRVYDKQDSLSDLVQGFSDYVKNGDGTDSSCPQDTSPVWIPRSNAHNLMMVNSDNRWTQAFRVEYTETALNNTAIDLGMSSTKLNHRIGCGGTPNQLTLVDAGKLYQAVRNGYIGYGSERNSFYNLMIMGQNDITPVINEEAANLGLDNTQINDFKSRVRAAAKAGNYDLNNALYVSIAGWVSFPAKTPTGVIVGKEYVHGMFIDKASSISPEFLIWNM